MGEAIQLPTELARGERRWSVGEAVLDERSMELRVGGEPLKLERKPIEVLLYLLQHAGDVVGEDELLQAVWPGRILGDNHVSQAISRIRKALGDADKSIITTVHGFGYRLVAPVRCEIISRPQPAAHFDFKPGDVPPLRPNWRLIERLGIGGNGEAWLVQQEKTREQRVFKFARDEAALVALKREITLFRLLNDTLGAKARILKLHDWNLEQAPYFIEAEYLPGGSLAQWVERLGGFEQLPLADRLETIARIADAVAALHSVGVLHKDLKPSNVLVERAERGPAEVRLGDLGSGGLLDPERLRQLNITRLGFTQTLASLHSGGGTQLYASPEVLAGQPPTVQADVYALGVMLYQMVVGDLHRVLSAGWERDVPDELLREDIALAAEGEVARRLVDAGELARRLRSLDARRKQRAAEREAAEKAAKIQQSLDRAKARKLGLIVAAVALILGSVASTVLWLDARKARAASEIQTAKARAVSEFLSKDMFAAVVSGEIPAKGLTVRRLLESTAARVDARFAGQEDVAGDVHAILADSFSALDERVSERRELQLAKERYDSSFGRGSSQSIEMASRLIVSDYSAGLLPLKLGDYERLVPLAQRALGSGSIPLLQLKLETARGRFLLGEWSRAEHELELLNISLPASASSNLPFRAKLESLYGWCLVRLANYAMGEKHLRLAADLIEKAHGPKHERMVRIRSQLASLYVEKGDYERASAELDTASRIAVEWSNDHSGERAIIEWERGRVALGRGDIPAALTALQSAVGRMQQLKQGGGVDQSPPVLQSLAHAFVADQDYAEAEKSLRVALQASSEFPGTQHADTRSIRMDFAEVLYIEGKTQEARTVLSTPILVHFDDLPSAHPLNTRLQDIKKLVFSN